MRSPHSARKSSLCTLQPCGLQHTRLPYPSLSSSLLRLMSVESVMPSNRLILCCPLHLLPSIFPSIRVFSNESILRIRWPKYWSFSFSISRSKECSGLISFRIDWLDLLAVQGILKSLLQHHSSKASILRCSAFIMVQLSHPYMTAAFIIWSSDPTTAGGIPSPEDLATSQCSSPCRCLGFTKLTPIHRTTILSNEGISNHEL